MPPSPPAAARPWPASTTATRNSPRSPRGRRVGPWVGNPVRYARLQPGQVVLDVGSGGGIDTILAARGVGPEGRAIGLDVLEEMCERGRGRRRGRGRGLDRVPAGGDGGHPAPRRVGGRGDLQWGAEPVGRKSRALAEIYRVLGPGGRMCMADLTVEGELPRRWPTTERLGRVSGGGDGGACLRRQTATGRVRRRLGRRAPAVRDRPGRPVSAVHPEVIQVMRQTIPADHQDHVATGVIVKARKPR